MPNTHLHATNIFQADGVQVEWDFNFDGVNPDNTSGATPYLYGADVRVQERYVDTDGAVVTADRERDLIAPNRVRVLGLPIAAGREVVVLRETENRFPLVDYRDRQTVTEADLDLQSRQTLFVAVEAYDLSARAIDAAQAAVATANAADATADNALTVAQEARSIATTANQTSNSANAAAAVAVQTANTATQTANAAAADAQAVRVLAQEARDDAGAAAQSADLAAQRADQAIGIASGVDAKATTALTNSQTALTRANTALDTANGIDAKATTALANADSALTAANAAVITADGVDGKAQDALDAAAAAVQTANTANSTAAAAQETAAAAQSGLSTVNLRVDGVALRATNLETEQVTQNNRLTSVENRATAVESRATVNEAAIAALQAAGITRKPSWISACAHAGMLMLVDGNVYVAAATANPYSNYVSARGTNTTSKIGLGNLSQVAIPSPSPVIQVETTGLSSWALLANGDLYVWGDNSYGQLGLGHTNPANTPTLSLTGVRALFGSPSQNSVGNAEVRMFVRDASNFLRGCGYNGYGALGLGTVATTVSSWTIITAMNAVSGATDVINIGARYGYTIFRHRTDGRLWACGYNGWGQLGLGTSVEANPTVVNITDQWGGAAEGQKIVSIQGTSGYSDSVTVAYSTLYIQYTDKIRMCGNNAHGQLGDGSTGFRTTPYVNAFLPVAPKQLVVLGGGATSVYMVGTDNQLYAWGYNGRGQLGTGDTVDKTLPTLVPGMGGVSTILSRGMDRDTWGYAVTVFVRMDATRNHDVMAAGVNAYGEVGNFAVGNVSTFSRVNLPRRDVDGSPFQITQLGVVASSRDSNGAWSIVAVSALGHLWAWGYNGSSFLVHPQVTTAERVPFNVPSPWLRGVQ